MTSTLNSALGESDDDPGKRFRFGTRLTIARDAAGASRKDIEEETGIPWTTLAKWERDEVSAPLCRIAVLADYYGVSLDWLVGRTDLPWTHKIRRGVLIVRSTLMQKFFAWVPSSRGERIPESLVGPAVKGIYRIPRVSDDSDIQILEGELAEALQQRVQRKISSLTGKGDSYS